MSRISELQLGLALAEGGKVEEARKHLQGLIESDPKDIRSYLAYGSVLSDAKDYAAMAANYDKAVDVIGPLPGKNTWTVFFQRGIAYERMKQWDKAEPSFRKALELNPEPAAGAELSRLFLDRHEQEPRRGSGHDQEGRRSAP
jgi:tetratricopeptide (TPR) repeat protein